MDDDLRRRLNDAFARQLKIDPTLEKLAAELERYVAKPEPEPLISPSMQWMIDGMRWRWSIPAGTAEDPIPDEAFPHLIQTPSVILILGSRGSGKTSSAFRLLELFEPHSSSKYVVGMPRSARSLLPKWINLTDSIFTLPDNVTALIDEAHLSLGPHMREVDRRELASLLALSRQRGQTLIFISQQARTISREIVSAADVLLIKSLREHQVKFDRPEFEEALSEAKAKLETIRIDRKPYSFVYSPDDGLNHLMRSEKPGFWTERLSKLYSNSTQPKSLTEETETLRRRRIQQAKQMRDQGFSIGSIGKRLGVSKGTAWNYVNR